MTRISVVMPVCDGRDQLASSLPALTAQSPFELLVVDDGSRDGSAETATRLGARVLASGGRRLGPAQARNVGVEHAAGEVILFVDADVVVHDDVLRRMREAFEDDALTAVFGSYDDEPPHKGFASQYMNLRHHCFHQDAAEAVPSFWAGLGAVRRQAFREVGGFDAQRYPQPSVEDIDLGVRLTVAGGRIRRDPAIRGTHIKRWSLAQVVRTDVLQRAVPWTALMLRHPGVFGDLNVSGTERWKALLAGLFWAATLGALLAVVPPWVPLLLLTAAGLVNRDLVRLFSRVNGPLFAVAALVFHQLYYLYSAATFTACRTGHALRAVLPP